MATFEFDIDGGNGGSTSIEADSLADAMTEAADWARDGDWDATDGTVRAHVRARRDWSADLLDAIENIAGDREVETAGRADWACRVYGGAEVLAELTAAMSEIDPAITVEDEGDGDVMIWAPEQMDSDRVIVAEPSEPQCEQTEHRWRSPHELLGGCEENPGVQGHGGGVVIREVCAHCGVYRVTDTWAQDWETGEQGLREVTYEDADDESLAWLRARQDAAE